MDYEVGSEFERWAYEEIKRVGLFDEDSDYGGDLGQELMKLVKTFSESGHSGSSAFMAASIFHQLTQWKPLTPLTTDPLEWMKVEESIVGDDHTWQSRRSPSCFSRDGGRTYYDIDEPLSWWRKVVQKLLKRRMEKIHYPVAAVTS